MAESSFGIKKIVDCKIGQDGKQMYKVKWEPTWEPSENLASCQHLIDEFWSFVNNAKNLEQPTQKQRKRPKLDMENNLQNRTMNLDNNYNLSEDNKADIHRLINRTNATQPGELITPSDMLNHPNNQSMMGFPQTPPHKNAKGNRIPQSPNHMKQGFGSPMQQDFGSPGQQNFGSPNQRGKINAYGNKGQNVKNEAEDTKLFIGTPDMKSSSISVSSLKYIENFDNQFVKIILVCKICNKEQSLKHPGNWRQHYYTHTEQKPHQCQHCTKSFIRADYLRKHVSKAHGIVDGQAVKMEMIAKMEPHFA